jgi:RNA polymerase sigma factor (sigma-70 family)
MPDGRLLKSIAYGDRHAFDELYRRYYRRLGGYLAQRLPPSYSTDEIIDDTFMIVWQHAGEFRYQSQVSTWIFGIAYRVALKSLRQNERWPSERTRTNRSWPLIRGRMPRNMIGLPRFVTSPRQTTPQNIAELPAGTLHSASCGGHHQELGRHREGAHVSRAQKIASFIARTSIAWRRWHSPIKLAPGDQLMNQLRRFGSVTVLNGHIHQIVQKVEGNITFHTARSTSYPQPVAGEGPGPLKVPMDQLPAILGVTSVSVLKHLRSLALRDTPLA